MRKILMASVVVGLVVTASPSKADQQCLPAYMEISRTYLSVLRLNIVGYTELLKSFEMLESSIKKGNTAATPIKIVQSLIDFSKGTLKTTKKRLAVLQKLLTVCPIETS